MQIFNSGCELLWKFKWPYLVWPLCRTHPSSLNACAKKGMLEKLVYPLTVFVDPIHDVPGHGHLPKSFQHSLRCCFFPNMRPPHLHQLPSLRSQILLYYYICINPWNMDLISPVLLHIFSLRLPSYQTPRQFQACKQDLVQNLNKVFLIKCWCISHYLGDAVLLSPPPWSGSIWVPSQLKFQMSGHLLQNLLGLDGQRQDFGLFEPFARIWTCRKAECLRTFCLLWWLSWWLWCSLPCDLHSGSCDRCNQIGCGLPCQAEEPRCSCTMPNGRRFSPPPPLQNLQAWSLCCSWLSHSSRYSVSSLSLLVHGNSLW